MNEQFLPLEFPEKGLDVNLPFSQQPPGTTANGKNVRFTDIAGRDRGGSRTGLSRHIATQPNGSNAIQLLDSIVHVDDDHLDGSDFQQGDFDWTTVAHPGTYILGYSDGAEWKISIPLALDYQGVWGPGPMMGPLTWPAWIPTPISLPANTFVWAYWKPGEFPFDFSSMPSSWDNMPWNDAGLPLTFGYPDANTPGFGKPGTNFNFKINWPSNKKKKKNPNDNSPLFLKSWIIFMNYRFFTSMRNIISSASLSAGIRVESNQTVFLNESITASEDASGITDRMQRRYILTSDGLAVQEGIPAAVMTAINSDFTPSFPILYADMKEMPVEYFGTGQFGTGNMLTTNAYFTVFAKTPDGAGVHLNSNQVVVRIKFWLYSAVYFLPTELSPATWTWTLKDTHSISVSSAGALGFIDVQFLDVFSSLHP